MQYFDGSVIVNVQSPRTNTQHTRVCTIHVTLDILPVLIAAHVNKESHVLSHFERCLGTPFVVHSARQYLHCLFHRHRTKYEESGNLNIAETQRLRHVSVDAFSTEPEHFFSRFRQISVSGITYFHNRYHVNKLWKREITFGNKFVSFSSFGGNMELRSSYVSFFFYFCPFPLR